ncbi:kxDL motif-containing protein 1-like [Chenopodium quinoa]|uniref:kxDL motif-containing protein 1-like n=1 Tax=Chenopodium quinoa TaxID=63459 RepID=UPI000B77451A|nr:kxDL motif-containing protein 1-like [Chenopodium quinoa]
MTYAVSILCRFIEMEESERAAIRAASKEVSHEVNTLMNAEAIDSLRQMQHLILGRLQDIKAVLSHFNEYSENRYADVMADFSKNTLLKSMKTDLDYIFLKLRSIKSKIFATYPDAFPNESLESG